MKHNQPLNEFTSLDFKKQIKHSFNQYSTSELSKNTDHIISLLAQLGQKHTVAFFKTVDAHFPGLSFHFIMEARHQPENKNCALLILRVSYFMGVFPEKELFAPMRKRLIQSLLFDDNRYSAFFLEVKNTFKHIETIKYLSSEEKKKLKKSLFKAFFNTYSQGASFNMLFSNVDKEEDNYTSINLNN